ncbi:MAG: long-chain-fatty-acid--CoA ligase [Gammaproteobacteria bacterium]|nr:long-chain-fatty-acid--CoA ligase [Gammaproteobacteria bacterium]
MQGLMMDQPLLITSIMQFAERHHGNREIVAVTADNPRHRYTYRAAFARTRRLANALAALGLQPGDRVATLAWNDHRHFELYYAISCSGAVCHTINQRLFPAQIEFIIRHAADRVLFVDPMFVPLVERLGPALAGVAARVVLTDRAHMPAAAAPDWLCYEDLLAEQSADFAWPTLDEQTASALCYTSGTTGEPKGVLFSHRSTVLHSYAVCLPDVMALHESDCIMPLVPMFHVNAWGVPYAAPLVGAKLVLPGPAMADGAQLHDLITTEKVNYALGVPTIWLALLAYLDAHGLQVPTLDRVCVGGAACPASIIERFGADYDVEVFHAWGMTEMSPVGTFNHGTAATDSWPAERRAAHRLRQGRSLFGVDMRIVDAAGAELPWDGTTVGALQVRGPWVARAYYRAPQSCLTADGWFDTGDVANIDPQGFMLITDRSKDVIKSGGEWISSIALENTAVNHPDVAEAAVIGRAHPKWDERPLLVVVPAAGADVSRSDLLDWYQGKVAKWWIPDDVAVVDELPHTATGKIDKKALREQFADYRFPAVRD